VNDNPTTPSRLELLRNRYPGWRIVRAEAPHSIGYTATRDGERIWAAHLTALASKLAEADQPKGE
jgi:hypothetical protein